MNELYPILNHEQKHYIVYPNSTIDGLKIGKNISSYFKSPVAQNIKFECWCFLCMKTYGLPILLCIKLYQVLLWLMKIKRSANFDRFEHGDLNDCLSITAERNGFAFFWNRIFFIRTLCLLNLFFPS